MTGIANNNCVCYLKVKNKQQPHAVKLNINVEDLIIPVLVTLFMHSDLHW